MTDPLHTLIIGYGNPYRRDDGVAFHVINAIRRRLGLRELSIEEDGEDELGQPVDTLMLHQLLPELSPMLARYEQVIFVDAHLGVIEQTVRVVPVVEALVFEAVTHHMSPGLLLAITRQMAGTAPPGVLVSVKGIDFDFGTELSPECRQYADEAIEKIALMVAS